MSIRSRWITYSYVKQVIVGSSLAVLGAGVVATAIAVPVVVVQQKNSYVPIKGDNINLMTDQELATLQFGYQRWLTENGTLAEVKITQKSHSEFEISVIDLSNVVKPKKYTINFLYNVATHTFTRTETIQGGTTTVTKDLTGQQVTDELRPKFDLGNKK